MSAAPGSDPVVIDSELPAPEGLVARLTPFVGQPMSMKLLSEVGNEIVLAWRDSDYPLVDVYYPEQNITPIVDEQESVNYALNFSKRGDLLLVLGDNIPRCWAQISQFKDTLDTTADPGTPVESVTDLPMTYEAASLAFGTELIADERGVRLARELSD